MFFVLRKQFVSAAVVLALCAHAGALPTMADYEQRLSIETSVMSVGSLKIDSISEYAQPAALAFADAAQVAQVFSQPTDISAYFASPQEFVYSAIQQSQDNNVKNLPAVPGAVLMVIVGFLCVSLVRDRKVWVSVFVVIVVLGQTGVKTLPKLTARLAQCRLSDRQAAKAAVVNPIPVGNYFNWFSNLGNYHYIGLLRRLAASPDGDSAFGNIRQGAAYCRKAGQQLSGLRAFCMRQYTVTLQQFIIPVQGSFNPLVGSLAERIMSIVYFSPAFIFGNLARSPPIPD